MSSSTLRSYYAWAASINIPADIQALSDFQKRFYPHSPPRLRSGYDRDRPLCEDTLTTLS